MSPETVDVAEALGPVSLADLNEIEACMRQHFFQAGTDGFTRQEIKAAARDARELLVLFREQH